ncbi:MAG TPA: GntR family transcriptional regulator [Zeimonas sp.]|nr:GntR family transcriptional regulator [Zeimonas sp.]
MELVLERPITESITSGIYRQLKRNLMIGRLKPGDTLTLKALSESLGTSQTPVREALLRLVSERLLTLVHGRSITVPVLTLETFLELRAIRIHLETFATRNAMPRLTDADVAAIEATHERYMECRHAGDYGGVLAANIDFHFRLYAAAGMPTLLAMIENLWAQTGPYAGFMYQTSATEHPDGHPHEHVIAALKARDVRRTVAMIRLDVQRHGNRMIEYLSTAGHFDQGAKADAAPRRRVARRPAPAAHDAGIGH